MVMIYEIHKLTNSQLFGELEGSLMLSTELLKEFKNRGLSPKTSTGASAC
tara:strand:+ start:8024 stop:8173 length:150 start_codon:yes stop_codon:yes gene_type:complete